MPQAPNGREGSRLLLLGSATLFILSCLFPLAASVLQAERLPKWVGVADVVIAAIVVVLGMIVLSRKPRGFAPPIIARSFTAYQGIAHIVLLLLAVFFLMGDHLRWGVLVPGLAWRGWLFMMVLPAWLSAWQMPQRSEG
jgi:hypothetical protein